MKKYLKLLLTCSLAIATTVVLIFPLASCGTNYESISTVEDLYAMESNKSYRLANDIDLQGRDWTPLEVENFDGNGYTISNASIIENSEYCGSGFLREAETVSNLTLDNINAMITFTNAKDGDKGYYSSVLSFGMVVGNCNELSNITIQNCIATINENYSSNLSTFFAVGMVAGEIFSADKITVNNCKLTLTNSHSGNVYTGALFGATKGGYSEVTNCIITETKLSFVNNDKYATSSCGSILGYISNTSATVSNCHVKDCIITAQSNSANITRAGGIAGFTEARVQSCHVEGTQITIDAENGYCTGGIAGRANGTITDCLSTNNRLEGTTSTNSSRIFCGVGGISAAAHGTITKSVVKDCAILGTYYTAEDMYACGITASLTGSVSYCGAYNNSISGGNTDSFCVESDTVFTSILVDAGQTAPNVNNVSIIPSEEWTNIISILSLDTSIWSFSSGELTLNV